MSLKWNHQEREFPYVLLWNKYGGRKREVGELESNFSLKVTKLPSVLNLEQFTIPSAAEQLHTLVGDIVINTPNWVS